jgi:hypothetical protein
MYILLILFVFILFAILCHDAYHIPENLNFINNTMTNASNEMIPNYKNNLFVNPKEFRQLSGERLDRLQNSYEGVQPEDMFFDIFNINCTQSIGIPWSCLLIKGNTINNIPRENCKTICPEKFNEETETEPDFKIEGFKNMEVPPSPSHYYCYNSCKQKCIKHKYNPLEPYKNSCGQNGISQVPLDVYLTEDDCNEKSFPCRNLSENECLGKPECGWCTNGIGEGQCFPSTPDGPLNLKIPCVPSRQNPTNSFKPGRLNPFEGVNQIF